LAARATPVAVRDDTGRTLCLEHFDALFSVTTPSPTNRWARSNGIALGVTWKDAAERARLELVERDRILRSWYGELSPTRIDEPDGVVPDALKLAHRLEWYEFGTEPDSVVALFGFPEPSAPFVYGFGAGRDREAAARSAAREWIQRLGFLWGEAVPTEPPDVAPTPDFHQEHYLYAGNLERVRAWLRGDHASFSGVLSAPRSALDAHYVDLTPAWLRSGLRVVKAVSGGRVPLCFGLGHPWAPACPEELMVHPIV